MPRSGARGSRSDGTAQDEGGEALLYRAAKQRFDDAQLLIEGNRLTGAVYLAGYTVECYLKALLLDHVNPKVRQELLSGFRGSRAHSIEGLGALFRRNVSSAIPHDVNRNLSRVAVWSTDLRYFTGVFQGADEFMTAVESFAAWAEGKF